MRSELHKVAHYIVQPGVCLEIQGKGLSLLGNTVKITFMFRKRMRPVGRLQNTTCNIAVILHGISVHCHRTREHVVIITALGFKAGQPLQTVHM